MSESQILQVKNFGKKSLNEIADLLEKHDLNFGMKYEDGPDGVRFTDRGTPPNRNVVTVAADDDEE
jgi:DNA-directed RNA polymerase subunit alpha